MFDIFSLMAMLDNYGERKVGRYEKDELLVDTCAVSDSDEPFETAVKHPKNNDNEMVIVEMYSSKEAAIKGHRKWVKRMTSKKLPNTLVDAGTSTTAKLVNYLKGCK